MNLAQKCKVRYFEVSLGTFKVIPNPLGQNEFFLKLFPHHLKKTRVSNLAFLMNEITSLKFPTTVRRLVECQLSKQKKGRANKLTFDLGLGSANVKWVEVFPTNPLSLVFSTSLLNVK